MKNCYFFFVEKLLCKKEAINCVTSKILFIQKKTRKQGMLVIGDWHNFYH